jgi:antitoxin VapB
VRRSTTAIIDTQSAKAAGAPTHQALVDHRIPQMVEWFQSYGREVDEHMGLNIKNEETHRLAVELAKLTGESLTAAVTQAVRERLDRIRREAGSSLADRLMAIGKDCAARLKEPFRSADHADLLYDERGLPR